MLTREEGSFMIEQFSFIFSVFLLLLFNYSEGNFLNVIQITTIFLILALATVPKHEF